MTLLQKIIKEIKEFDHEVVLELQSALATHPADTDEYYVRLVREWLDELQEMYNKAERIDDIENNLYRIDNLIDDAHNSLDEMRAYTNV